MTKLSPTFEQMADHLEILVEQLRDAAQRVATHSEPMALQASTATDMATGSLFMFSLTIFMLACFVGYFVVWKVTPSLHTPLMAVTNAISSIIIVGAILALGPKEGGMAWFFGFAATLLASINIFGGFVVTQRMLAMFKKKD